MNGSVCSSLDNTTLACQNKTNSITEILLASQPLFRKILVANRGEIAVRVIHACRELGITSIAVYSEADQAALHVRLADEAYFLGPAPVSESYLNQDKLLEIARQHGAQAIHPGYGLLSENASFARRVENAGLVFIGPSAASIEAMGDKAAARRAMIEAQVPVVPGYENLPDDDAFIQAARQLGYPVLVKAAAGGGGKGLRVVEKEEDLKEAMQAARYEARYAFGADHLILETYIPFAHHVEFQVLGDQHGNLLHLFERECSVQRRHQKIIEESPSPLLDDELRSQMGMAALAAARSIGYTNAGTIEFILDPARRLFFFLEMNTRLQVEHPVTELVTGIDLVQWQIRIAAGLPLTYTQEQLFQRGHAIECRLYAEDPENNFLPATGKLLRFNEPRSPGVRVDSGLSSGDLISPYYDPLIAKLIAWAEDRPSAIHKMQTALRETVLLGLPTNWQFLLEVLASDAFQSGRLHTTWIEQEMSDWQAPRCDLLPEVLAAAALTHFKDTAGSTPDQQSRGIDPYSPWLASSLFRLGEQP